ncbi:hypothetical protein [Nocardioides dilutus]
MTWHTLVVDPEDLAGLVETVRTGGGTITSCRPQPGGICVTWTMPST